jgi:hypothetical protein
MPLPTIDELLDQSIDAYKDGDKEISSKILAKVIQLDPNNERAWLWISGIVSSDAERLFCIKRILAINPQNEVAKYGLNLLPADIEPIQPSLQKQNEKGVEICTFPGCNKPVSQPGFKFCYKHWKAVNAPLEVPATLNATALGERFKLTSRKINLIMAELGWITKQKKGWILTDRGETLGATEKVYTQTGVPYLLWPETIVNNKALLATIQSLAGEVEASSEQTAPKENNFREKFIPTHRSTDGHWVRSKAEMLIDNWLYMAGVIHAYERRLPIEEELFCDFYIPEGKVYIEFWGFEKDPKYLARKEEKRKIYQKYKLNLIEMTDDQIKNLDDFLPKALLQFSVIVS